MLTELVIENIAVIERAEISFSGGFNVLSGETGAGKSLIVDSLNAITGARTSRDIIRSGEKRGCVTAVFEQVPLHINTLLEEQGIEPEGSLILKREIFSDGRNNCRINGAPVTLSILRSIGENLVSIHGQHDGRHLMDENLHIDYLDSFGDIGDKLAAYQAEYAELMQMNKELRRLQEQEQGKAARLAELNEIIADLKTLDLSEGEYEELPEKRRILTESMQSAEALSSAAVFLDGDGEDAGALQLLAQAANALRQMPDVNGTTERAEALCALGRELSSEVASRFERLDFSEEVLAETEERLDEINRLSVKYGCENGALWSLLEAAETEKQELDSGEEELTKMTESYAKKREKTAAKAKALSDSRTKASKTLSKEIEARLERLDMPGSRFFVDLSSTISESKARFTKKGTDAVRFLLAANRGEELKPLSKVASGGELSRIMLAVKTVLSKPDEGGSAVFDEIDTGVSGRAASHVGEQLYQIALKQQVLCVTHLPQIACLADRQFRISKSEEGARVYTVVTPLEDAGRAEELARLMSGAYAEEMSMDSAKKLLKSAEEAKAKIVKEAQA